MTTKQDKTVEKQATKTKASETVIKTLDEVKAEIKPGMTIRIYQKIKELNPKGEEKERLQYFEGIVLAHKHGKTKGATITVSKSTDGVNVEKIFPLSLPTITKIEIKKAAKVKQAKLYFLKRGYKKRLKTTDVKIESK